MIQSSVYPKLPFTLHNLSQFLIKSSKSDLEDPNPASSIKIFAERSSTKDYELQLPALAGPRRRQVATETRIHVLPQSITAFLEASASMSRPIASYNDNHCISPIKFARRLSVENIVIWVSISTIFGFIINLALVEPTFKGLRLARDSVLLEHWTTLKDFM